MAFRPLKMLKNLLLLLLLIWAAKKLGKLATAPFRMLAKPIKAVPWKKMLDAGRKGVGKAFEKIKDFGKNLFKKKDAQTPSSLLSDNAQKPVLNEVMTNVEPSKLVYKVPKEVRGVVLQPDERGLLRNGKPVLLTGMNGDNGEKFSSYVKMNTVKGQLDFYNDNPDRPRHNSRFAEGQNHRHQQDKHQKSGNKLKIA
jgi:hypothetical protein